MKTLAQRTPRQWIEPCHRCGGSGTVQQRQHFALWTPEEFEQVEAIDPKFNVPADAYVCTGVPGASILETCKEALGIAAQVERPVAFMFNGTLVLVRVGDDPNALAEGWWLRATGKTYAENVADR